MLNKVKQAMDLLLLIVLAIAFVSLREYNSDTLSAFSQAKDILQFGSLKGWTFSATPYTFPDVILSLPFTFFIDNPYRFHLITAPVQFMIFAYLFSSYYATHNVYAKRENVFASIALSAVIVTLVEVMVFREVFYFTAEPFFILAYHGFAALCAILIFLYSRNDLVGFFKKNYIVMPLLLLMLIASDFYFAMYFGCFAVTTLNKRNWRKSISLLAVFLILSIIVFALSYVFNESLAVQASNSLSVTYYSRITIFLRIGLLLLVPTAFILVLKYKRQLTAYAIQLYVGLILIATVIFIMGLISDQYTFRYLIVIYPVSIILGMEILLTIPTGSRLKLLCCSWVVALLVAGYANFFKDKPAGIVYNDEIQYIRETGIDHATIVATYWPAKIIFESTKRQHNLIQTDDALNKRNWVNNTKWGSLYSDSEWTFVVTEQLSKQAIQRLETEYDTQSLGNGKVLLIHAPAANIISLK